MSDQLARAVRRPGALPAFLTALGVFAALLAMRVAGTVLNSVQLLLDGGFAYLGGVWAGEFAWSFSGLVPFAFGVFLSLWQLGPIAGTLRLAHVVTRAILAAAIGAAVLWIVSLVAGFVVALVQAGWSGDLGASLAQVSPLDLFFAALHTFVQALPVVVLGAVFLWGWLQRHPSTATPVGALDEV